MKFLFSFIEIIQIFARYVCMRYGLFLLNNSMHGWPNWKEGTANKWQKKIFFFGRNFVGVKPLEFNMIG